MSRFSTLSALVVLAATSVAAGPCDIYASGGTPCVAAHSTTRALYSAYDGALYQILRDSDQVTVDIYPIETGGVANGPASQDFCVDTTCVITTIYDQSGKGNHLTQAPPGGAATGTDPNGYDNQAAAFGAPVTLNGLLAFGVFIAPGTGYRNDATNGIATGDAAEGMYAVFDGTHYNGGCCMDYGNAEVSAHDTGNGHMEAVYFGLGTGFATGAGSGPWILADLENGLYVGDNTAVNENDPAVTSRFITGFVKGEPGNQWAVRGGDPTTGNVATYYSGVRPSPDYNPMSKEGAIILGIGGDNSDASQGTFYEGVMTTGYPADDIENQVQQNIQAAGYAVTSLVSGPAVSVGSAVSFQATTACCTTRYIAHSGDEVNTQVVDSSSDSALKLSASWNVVTGLGNSGCVSFESRDTPGSYIRHSGFELYVDANDGSALFGTDATWCPQSGINGEGNSIRSWSYPAHYFRHYNAIGYAASNGGPSDFDTTTLFVNDTTWIVGAAWA
ncbi:Alpha-N-arabinofuranosidase [Mycena chlorophos]|uniref:Alpha-L-arabinofuranosidase n=1 Tax=Mycena chlorophos TaxID=658473 RepID=A0A8H6TBV1_MYCCL|nr:Alpha-N-arabinofuranosidase [Mycena chlorophos]